MGNHKFWAWLMLVSCVMCIVSGHLLLTRNEKEK